MNYRLQERFLTQSRILGATCVGFVLAAGIYCLRAAGVTGSRTIVPYLLTLLAVAGSLYYTPDYLHLSIDEKKPASWAYRVRWRIIAVVLVLGLLFATGARGYIEVLLAVIWLSAANLLAKATVPDHVVPSFLWLTDCALIAGLLLQASFDFPLGSILLAAVLHLAIVTRQRQLPLSAISVMISTWLFILICSQPNIGLASLMPELSLLFITGVTTLWLVLRARKQSVQNVSAAMEELIDFTGYSGDKVRQLWANSNQQLAQNWQTAAIPGDDRERLTAWYRDNSELYLFAISAYNLEYKRIRSNLKVLKFARGACLDYGAGNGELLLEMARRGHPVTYYDVEGVTMRFARRRAENAGLVMDFTHSKDALAAIAQKRRFDTIFAFDVLEHLPDLPGELDFLSSLLNNDGIFVFDVPAGSTSAHPMHLNHNLDVLAYMRSKKLEDRRGILLRLPFRKEEKYVFRMPLLPEIALPGK